MAEYILETRNLGISFGGLKAAQDVNLRIRKNQIYGLIGPNGAGKTTVFNLLTKVYQPTSGTVLINGKDTAGMDTVAANKAGIARTFQNIRLFSNMSVEENVRIGLHNQIGYGMFSGILRLPNYWKQEKKQHEKARQMLLDNHDKLQELALYLYEKETITGDEFMTILNQ